jgi:hypothetical protein
MTRRAIAIALAIGLLFAGASAAVWAQGALRPDLTTSQGTDRDRLKVLGHQFNVFSGDDVGIRVTGQKDANGRVPGTLVVKINGQWVDVVTPPAVTTTDR